MAQAPTILGLHHCTAFLDQAGVGRWSQGLSWGLGQPRHGPWLRISCSPPLEVSRPILPGQIGAPAPCSPQPSHPQQPAPPVAPQWGATAWALLCFLWQGGPARESAQPGLGWGLRRFPQTLGYRNCPGWVFGLRFSGIEAILGSFCPLTLRCC